jgi:hypothetical protein
VTFSALAFLLDRQNEAATVGAGNIRNLGGGWQVGVDIWRRSGFRFSIIIAPSAERINSSALLAFIARDIEALRSRAVSACEQAAGLRCRWEFFANEDALTTVREEILRAMQEGGSA